MCFTIQSVSRIDVLSTAADTRYVPADAGFLCDQAAVLEMTIKEEETSHDAKSAQLQR